MIDKNIIHATPTKDLFISMLIRDISLLDAINDLVDNSIDGAKSISSNNNFEGLSIKINAQSSGFEITDNCGGIPVSTARDYAFRFGRPTGMKETPQSIGRFGIGMKRALFKIGEEFRIESVSKDSSFKLHLDVKAWSKTDEWDFSFDSYKEGLSNQKNKTNTKITVKTLNPEVKLSFGNSNFIKNLKTRLELSQMHSLNNGLSILINGSNLKPRQLDLLDNTEFKSSYWKHEFEDEMKVEVFSGISEDKGEDGGWYVFCNNRLIIGPDTTEVTGWTGKNGDGVAEYHDQFHRFRGFVFFESRDSALLPWNTTKTGMDMDSPNYQFVRKQMILMMRPIMTLLNHLKKERESDTPERNRVLNHKLNQLKPVSLSKVISKKGSLPAVFKFPDPKKIASKDKKDISTITYTVPSKKLEKVKEYFGAVTNADVGEKTFNYFYEMEIK
jgi:hypothetical protein